VRLRRYDAGDEAAAIALFDGDEADQFASVSAMTILAAELAGGLSAARFFRRRHQFAAPALAPPVEPRGWTQAPRRAML
jgi:hypothetical protein